jgi:hypothetical protein
MTSSRISGFYNLSIDDRRAKIADSSHLTPEDLLPFTDGGLTPEAADHMIENVIGRIVCRSASDSTSRSMEKTCWFLLPSKNPRW